MTDTDILDKITKIVNEYVDDEDASACDSMEKL